MDAGADDTRAKRKQFGVFLCLPMALVVLLLIRNGDFGMSPIYGHHRAKHSLPKDMYVGRRTLAAMGVEKLIADLCEERRIQFSIAEIGVLFPRLFMQLFLRLFPRY